MMMVVTPVPYVDASAAWAFPDKRQRMVVGAAGMLVELFIAAIAVMVWLHAEPGLVRTVAFATIVSVGISTLFFNANPLLRFDGYYILCDWLEIPNLWPRARLYLGYLCERYAFGRQDAEPPTGHRRGARLVRAVRRQLIRLPSRRRRRHRDVSRATLAAARRDLRRPRRHRLGAPAPRQGRRLPCRQPALAQGSSPGHRGVRRRSRSRRLSRRGAAGAGPEPGGRRGVDTGRVVRAGARGRLHPGVDSHARRPRAPRRCAHRADGSRAARTDRAARGTPPRAARAL